MTTSLATYLKQLPDLTPEQIPDGVLGYLRSHTRNQAHQNVLEHFLKLSSEGKMTKALLASRLGKDPAHINRLLGSAGNWTLDTYADLLTALGQMPVIDSKPVGAGVEPNECHPDYEKALYIVVIETATTTRYIAKPMPVESSSPVAQTPVYILPTHRIARPLVIQ